MRWALVAVGFVVGCAGDAELQWVGGPSRDDGGETTIDGDPAGESTTVAADDSTTDPPSLFLGHLDLGEDHRCDLWAQDCPAGTKCMLWANDGGSAWNATKCSPIDPDPDAVGEPCTVVGSGVSGIDSCDLGLMCWDVDPETNEGVCVAHCVGDSSDPKCLEPAHHCVGRTVQLCLPSCCPVEQDCEEGRACYPAVDTFMCAPDASGESGAFGDPCEFLNVCDPGLFCTAPELVPGCVGSGCCAPFCDLGSETCSDFHPDLECVPWFEEGEAPHLYEHTGACVVPQ